MKKIFLAVFVCWTVMLSAAEVVVPDRFRHIGISDGLPDNYVKNVFGLPDGRLGVRTTELLNLYDGKNFVSFPLWKASGFLLSSQLSGIPVQYVDSSGRLWLKERGMLRVFDLDTEHFVRADTIFERWKLDGVSNLFVDEDKQIWVTDKRHCLHLVDDAEGVVRTLCDKSGIVERHGNVLTVASVRGKIWIVHESGLIRCYDMQTSKFVRQETFLLGRLPKGSMLSMKMMENGDFWLAWSSGGGYYSEAARAWTELPFSSENVGEIAALDVDVMGHAWFGTSMQGIYVVDKYTFELHQAEPFYEDNRRNDVRSNVHSIYSDPRSGVMWVGLFNQGLAFYHPSMDNFILHNNGNLSGRLGDENIHCMVEENDGSILFGTSKGVYRYVLSTRTVERPYPELSTQLFRTAYKDSFGKIWLGTFRNGLYCIDKGKIRHFLVRPHGELVVNNIRSMIEDSRHRLWVSVYGGLGVFDPETDSFELLADRFPEIGKYRVANALAFDGTGRLVVGADNGLYFYDIRNDSLQVPELDAPDSPIQTLGSNKYNCFFLDSRNLLWMGTQYGVKVMSGNGNVDYLGKEAGFANLTVQSIQEDNNGDMWVSTINALYKVTVEKKPEGYQYDVVCLDRNRNHSWNDLFEFCSLKTFDGLLCFGRMDGFYLFSPENVMLTPCSVSPMFTGFRLANEPVTCGEVYNGRVLFPRVIDKVRYAELYHDENSVTFEFSSLNFVNPAQTYFRYKLDGVDKDWIELLPESGQANAVYNHLPPGKYTFYVMSAGNDHRWSDVSSFTLVIRPPFWATVWAGILYLMCILALGYAIIRYFHRRNYRKLLRMQEEEAIRQREELNQMKFRFFINISHELRTPLTLILTPLEVLRKKVNDGKIVSQLDVIYKNAQELYRLINQLLDFRKIEMKREKLNLSPGDLGEFVGSIYEGFRPYALDKKVDFHFQMESSYWYMNFDHDKLHKIVNNLLSNAFKFTPEGGRVTLALDKEEQDGRPFVCISVSDTGIGISPEEAAHIFERFYQVQSRNESKVGSGIGLHLVKEYVEIHQGSISVDSVPGKGSTFVVRIPMDMMQEEKLYQEPLHEEEEEERIEMPVSEDGRKRLLVVEDNNEFRRFLKEQLSESYGVLEASDGEEGEKIAIEQNPDLIISDVMMPKVDGLELCRRIKTNMTTSHIPIILLTARTADDIRISGYKVGADSYISKPFNFDVLLIRIRKLIEQQDIRKKEFQKGIHVDPGKITITSLDEQLIQKALGCIEKNMDNAEYNVEALSADMGMSRMNLYRKLQSITGQSPTEFIRTIRLKRAAQLLEGSQLTIAEVADRVGFNSASYFSKCFKEQFGMLPTQYQEEKDRQ